MSGQAGARDDSAPGLGCWLLWARTVVQLRPAQVAHRARLKAQRAAISLAPDPARRLLSRGSGPAPGWPPTFVPLDSMADHGAPSAEANADGRFELLGQERVVATAEAWGDPGGSRLWGFHLHYLEWAWAFAGHARPVWAAREFARLWRSWRAGARWPVGDPWSPYVASLRAWVLCGVYRALVADSEIEDDYISDLWLHAGYLRAHVEWDVGGNHLIKNLKAIVGLGVFLGDGKLTAFAAETLERQIGVQVLADGGHFERSPSYHCQVLGDLLDVARLLGAAGLPSVPGLEGAVSAMRRWLGAMLMPDGDVPLFNDCVPVGAQRIRLLRPERPPWRRLTVLEGSGYVVMRPDDRSQLVADVGPPCPRDLPAHAHADCLSFELAVDGQRVVVDTGTSTYQGGGRRRHERSTGAHNTVAVDGADQTEVWGTFRAARRARPVLEQVAEGPGAVHLVASHDGYRRLPGRPRHRRAWRVRSGWAEIVDEVSGARAHRVVGRLHLAPGVEVGRSGDGGLCAGPLCVEVLGGHVSVEPVEVAQGFGVLRPSQALVVRTDGPLPLRLSTTLQWGPFPAEPRPAGWTRR